MIVIRPENIDDYSAVHSVIESAFGQADEADLVDALRTVASPQISLVAVENNRIVGHIFFSPVSVESAGDIFTALGLAPLAVLPECQKRGIGSRLVQEGLMECQRIDHNVVFVVGHPEYYPRFGFNVAKEKGFSCEFPVRDEVFMVAELKPGALSGKQGLVKYLPEFGITESG
jgi:putative acetyltransferase